MFQRMFRAVKLEPAFYREVKADSSLDQEALTVVLLVAAIGAVLQLLFGLFTSALGFGSFVGTVLGAVGGFVATVVIYFVAAYAIWYIGTNYFGGNATVEEVRRALGYAYTPNLISAIPCLGLIGVLWSLATFFVATRESLNVDNTNAALTVIAYVVVMIVVSFILGLIGLGGFGLGALGGLGR